MMTTEQRRLMTKARHALEDNAIRLHTDEQLDDDDSKAEVLYLTSLAYALEDALRQDGAKQTGGSNGRIDTTK